MRKRKQLKQQNEKVKKNKKNPLLWMLSIFLLLSCLIYLPSIASVLFLINMILVLPNNKIQDSLKNVFPKKFLKTGLCWVIFFVAVMIAPADDSAINEISAETVESSVKEQREIVSNYIEVETEEVQIKEKSLKVTKMQENEPLPENSYFEIHYIDVGQADSALVLCDGQAMLIDGGNGKDSTLIYSYLKSHDVSHLEYIVATHAHEDHVGGLAGALNYATVGTAYCSVDEYDSETFGDFVKYLAKQDKEITIPNVGENFKLGSADVEILAVNGNATDPNNASIVLQIKYGDTSFIFTGDAEREVEEKVLNSGYELESTVLKVGHHGSENATSYAFLRQVAPKYAVISVGEDNIYGHPTEDTLSRLRDADVKTYRTDLQGTIVCVSDGTEVSFSVDRNEDADTLALAATVEQLQEIEVTNYIGNINTYKFHYSWCSSVKQMKESNKYYYNGTRDEMIGKGYDPCQNCNP